MWWVTKIKWDSWFFFTVEWFYFKWNGFFSVEWFFSSIIVFFHCIGMVLSSEICFLPVIWFFSSGMVFFSSGMVLLQVAFITCLILNSHTLCHHVPSEGISNNSKRQSKFIKKTTKNSWLWEYKRKLGETK